MLLSTDLDVIAEQLGRPVRGVRDVAYRCPAGHPTVLTIAPLSPNRHGQHQPMPTLYWLSCPELRRKVSRLEARGTIGKLEQRLQSAPSLMVAYLDAHESYILDRFSAMTLEERGWCLQNGFLGMFRRKGIGGLGNLQAIKCLHLHLAHELAASNPIGRLLRTEYGIHPCREPVSRPGASADKSDSPCDPCA